MKIYTQDEELAHLSWAQSSRAVYQVCDVAQSPFTGYRPSG